MHDLKVLTSSSRKTSRRRRRGSYHRRNHGHQNADHRARHGRNFSHSAADARRTIIRIIVVSRPRKQRERIIIPHKRSHITRLGRRRSRTLFRIPISHIPNLQNIPPLRQLLLKIRRIPTIILIPGLRRRDHDESIRCRQGRDENSDLVRYVSYQFVVGPCDGDYGS